MPRIHHKPPLASKWKKPQDARMERITFHDFTIDAGTRAEQQEHLRALLSENAFHQVITINPEYIVLAKQYPKLRALSQHVALSLVDGVGLVFALHRSRRVERYQGADAVADLFNEAEHRKFTVGILIPSTGLSSITLVEQTLRTRHPMLKFVCWDDERRALLEISQSTIDILFVAFGQPSQDFWIDEHRAQLKHVRVAMGVGGSIDFLTGKRTRAPRLMRRLGVEWLWRMVTQPKRFPRIIRATFGFWYTLLTS